MCERLAPTRSLRARVTLLLVSPPWVTLRPVCHVVYVVDVDTLRDLLRLSVEGVAAEMFVGNIRGVLALVLVPPGCPLLCNSGFPTQVQNVHVLLLKLAILLN